MKQLIEIPADALQEGDIIFCPYTRKYAVIGKVHKYDYMIRAEVIGSSIQLTLDLGDGTAFILVDPAEDYEKAQNMEKNS